MKTLLMVVFIAALTAGCVSTPVIWSTSGGSKADGFVELSYTYNYMQTPVTDESAGLEKAAGMCKLWGFSNATPLEMVDHKCQYADRYGCSEWLVTRRYVCS